MDDKKPNRWIRGRNRGCRILAIFLFALLSLVNTGVQAGGPETQSAGKDEGSALSKPVASVNGVEIRALDLKKAMEGRIPETGHRNLSQKRLTEMRTEELNKLIGQEILFQEAQRLKIKVKPESVEAELQKIESRFPSEEKYQKALKAQGLTLEDIRGGVERYLAIKQLTDQEVRSKISIGDDQMKRYFDGHRDQFKRPPQIRLRILLIRVDPSGLASDWEKARQKAQELADRARKGEDFEKLVREFSDEEELKSKGGDTGLLHQGRLPYAELEGVAYDRNVGSFSDPVQTLYGYVVFKVEEKQPAQQMAFDDLNKDLLRKEMQESATDAKLKEWMDGLRAKAEIKVY
ncbi:MAG: SurA N-terminal domain-containing protein [Nitrospirae bacterium]|nr:SurA N-terminal domain-containing protein [Nitrospirota bacterium]